MSHLPEHRPLLSGRGLLSLIAGAALLLLVLLPVAQRRQQQAAELVPSALSLSYLELSLAKHPEDNALRMELARKLFQVGQHAKARDHVLPLLTLSGAPGFDARMLLIEIDRSRWIAIPEGDRDAREAACAVVVDDMREIDAAALPARDAERFARQYRELLQPVKAAEILEAIARRGLPDTIVRVEAADAAWLEAGLPLRAAELHAWFAQQKGEAGRLQARLAIERARGGASPQAIDGIFKRMRALYPDDVALLELGVALAEEHDVQQAFELAGQLVKRYPDDARYHRNVARLAEATGRSLRALDEYVWLVRHGGNEQDRIRALALARANWDLQAVRELTEGGRAAPRKTCIDRRGSSRCGAGRAQPARCPGCQAAAGEWRIFASRETRLERPAHARNSRCEAAPSKPARVGPRVRQLRERVALYEALGDVTAARQQLTAAVARTDTGNDESVWQQKLQLELRVGDDHAALETLTEMLRRFPSGPLREQLANMQLAAGRADAALQTLTAAPEPQDESWLRRLARLAWEAGDVNAERRSYERLAASPAATAQDFQRLWELAPDRANALRIALASYRRFDSGDMLNAAAAMYAEQGDEDTQLALLAEAERLPSVNAQVSYWQTRITLHQRRAARAASKASYSTAKHELDAAESLLARAARCAPADALYAQLLTGQSAQTLALGLASDDMRLVARAYAADSRRLSMRERVYILNRLGRRDEALALALQGARTTDGTESDRAALEADARNLGRDRTRYVRTSGEALSMDGLLAVRGGGAFEYAGKAAGIRGEAGYSEYRPTSSADSVLKSEARDVSGQLQGRISSTSLELGVRVRNETSARPFGALAVQLLGGPHVDGASALMRVHVNDTTADTARLRALGVRDAVSLETTLPFGKHVYFNARGAAEAFYTRQERAYLGAGLSLDAGLGTSYALPADLGTAGLRLATRVAPRFARRPGAVDGQAADVAWLSQSSEWAGLGASIGRGSLDVPPLVGRQLCYVLDASAGWLWPASDVGFTAQAGLGMSLAGADMLSISARAGNIVGSSSWSTSIGYGLTFDR